MSREHDEKHARGQSRQPARKARQAPSNFVSFHPTEAEKKAIKAMELEGDGLLEAIADLTARGLQVTFTRARTDNAECVLVKERGLEFGQGVTVAFFHANIQVALRSMVYGLSVKWPNYPEQDPIGSNHTFDW